MLKNTVQYGKSAGMEVSRTASGNDSGVIGRVGGDGKAQAGWP